jgi:hypothetical protein
MLAKAADLLAKELHAQSAHLSGDCLMPRNVREYASVLADL